MNSRRDVLRGSDVLVHDGKIQAVGKVSRGRNALRVLDAQGCAVIPGLIHGHLHACQTLFRNQAEGLALLDWLKRRIWPLEAAHTFASMRASADLTFAELIRSGATAALDMGSVHHYDAVFESARDCGFRLTGGKAMMDVGKGVPRGLRENRRDSISESLRLLKTWHGAEKGRLRYAFAPRFALSCSKALLKEVSRLALEFGVGIHTHASENPTECTVVRQEVGLDNVDYFHRLGLSGPHVTLAHCVWLTPKEQRLLRETRTVVCHCPSSNLKLASGLAKVPELLADGVTVALGADGAPCNNNLDLFLEMRLAALIHKPRTGAHSMTPLQVLEMATLHGAQAIGQGQQLGSIEVGKGADLTVVELNGLHAQPSGGDVVAQLVYSAHSRDVRDVIIAGRWVLRNRELLTIDEAAVRKRAQRHAAKISATVS